MEAGVRLRARGVIAALVLTLAACSSESDRPPPKGSTATGGTGGMGGAPAEPSLCDPGATWGAPEAIDLGSNEPMQFASVTPDELSIAWLLPDAEGEATVHYADRDSVDEPFGPARSLGAAEGFYALDSAALGPDGLSLVVVRIDRFGFGVATRPSRSDDFGEVTAGVYSNLNPNLNDTNPNASQIGDPVLAPDELVFVYSDYAEGFDDTIRIAIRDDAADAFTSTVAFGTPELRPEGILRRRPSGLSADYRTLFYWDEIDGVERAAFRDSDTSDFGEFVELGGFRQAQPNQTCTKLYFGLDDAPAFARVTPP